MTLIDNHFLMYYITVFLADINLFENPAT